MSQNTNIYNKLDYLDETKQLILQAIKDKGINPGDVAEVFRQYPSFIRAIETLDTSDATALPQDIAIGKTAYVNSNKITGTTPKVTKIDATALPSINNNGLKFAYNQPYRALLEPEANVGLSVSNINMANFLELRADNLRNGYTLFGVTGNYEGGIDTSDATATAKDIVRNQTAYVNGQKLTGNLYTIKENDNARMVC